MEIEKCNFILKIDVEFMELDILTGGKIFLKNLDQFCGLKITNFIPIK